MSRSGYSEDCDGWELIRWRGAVASAIRGKRGQSFLREMLTALEALPQKRLIAEQLEEGGEVCAIGSVGKLRGLDMSRLDPEYSDHIAKVFGVSEALVKEIESINDGDFCWRGDMTPEKRFDTVRKWVVTQLTKGTVEEYGQVTP